MLVQESLARHFKIYKLDRFNFIDFALIKFKRMLDGASITNIKDIFEGWSDYAWNNLTSKNLACLMTIVTQKNYIDITPSTLGADRVK